MKNLGNQSHYTRQSNYYEWWYFDFTADNGIFFNVVLHETDLFGLSRVPYCSLSCLKDGSQFYFRNKGKISINKGGNCLSTSRSKIIESDRYLDINQCFENDSKLELRMIKGRKIGSLHNGVLYKAGSGFGMWKPNVIGGRFRGIITLYGKKHYVKGIAYQDHQWGNLTINMCIKDWIWGHFDNKQISVVFFKILTNNGEMINRYYVKKKDELSDAGVSKIQTDILKTLSKIQAVEDTDNQEVSIKLNSCLIQTAISPVNLVRAHIEEKVGEKKYSYFRWKTDSLVNGVNCTGVVEYMRFR